MEILVPEVGESIFEATIAKWHVAEGSRITKDDLLCELETDKISLELHAEDSGTIHLNVEEGETVKIGTVIATLIDSKNLAEAPKPAPRPESVSPQAEPAAVPAAPRKLATVPTPTPAAPAPQPAVVGTPETVDLPHPADDDRVRRVPMSPIRKKIAAHLLAARQQTAMLTTFNEADMSRLMTLRGEYKDAFQQKFGVKLGMMSFFVRAVVTALKAVPEVNARIDGDDIVYHDFYDMGIAVGGKKGLVVPVLRDADQLSSAEIETAIVEFGQKVQTNKLTLADLEGGTFTISNGGVYGSMLSTPIINPPQTGVLGMHNIIQRPVAIDGKVEIRPMMYLALSYDHRVIDGKQAVTFLKTVKEFIEQVDVSLLEL